jgi:type I restriction enzyme S subunit
LRRDSTYALRLTEATLSEVCALVTDGTHDTPKRVESGFPLIKAKEIVGGRIDFETCDQISPADHFRVIARSKPEKGDTLFAHIGASLGEAAYVGTDRPFSIKNIALFKPNPTKIIGRYLYYLVVSPEFQALAKRARMGAAQPFLSLGHLRAHRIRFHKDLEVQRGIVGVLSSYDDLIDVNTRRIALLEGLAQRLFNEWFLKFRYPGCKRRKVVRDIGEMPDDWNAGSFADVVDILSGGTPRKDRADFWGGHIPFFTPRDAPSEAWVLDTSAHITETGLNACNSQLYPQQTVFITARGTVGKVALAGHPMAMNQSCYALRGRGYPQFFLFHFARVAVDRLRARRLVEPRQVGHERAPVAQPRLPIGASERKRRHGQPAEMPLPP